MIGPLLIAPLLVLSAFAQSHTENQPVKPFRIIDNIYYVGGSDITSFLITSSQGHILLDGGFEQTAPQILASIRTLGFNPKDVKVLLISQAHYDHAGGLVELKRATGAKLYATKLDGEVLARGGKHDFGFGDRFLFPPITPDVFVSDGQEVRVGSAVMVAHITPGHTKGCTSYTTKAGSHNVLFDCSTSVPGYQLVSPPAYPNIVADYERSFALLKSLPCDIPLGAHGSFFHLQEKMKKLGASPNPFIDPQGCRAMIEDSERDFQKTLAEQRQRAAKK